MADRDYYAEEEQDPSSEARYRNKEKRVGYVPVSNALIRLFADLPDAALRTYLTLCSYAFGRGETFVGQETLCQIRGAHLSTIIKHITALKDAGLISVERRGQGKTNIYIIEDIPEKALDEYIRLFIEKEDLSAHSASPNTTSKKREVLTSQKRKVKTSGNRETRTSPKRKTSNKTLERTTDEQQPSLLALDLSSPSLPTGANDSHVVVAAPETHPALDDILTRLLALGVARSTAKAILRHYDALVVYRWLAYAEQKLATGWVPQESPAAWLVTAIRSGDWVIPSWFQTAEEQEAAASQVQKTSARERTLREKAAELESREAAEQRRRMEGELGVGERTREHWERAKLLMAEWGEFSPVFYSAFLLPLNGGTATITTPVQFYCQQIERHSDVLKRAIQEVSGRPIETLEVTHFQPAAAPDG